MWWWLIEDKLRPNSWGFVAGLDYQVYDKWCNESEREEEQEKDREREGGRESKSLFRCVHIQGKEVDWTMMWGNRLKAWFQARQCHGRGGKTMTPFFALIVLSLSHASLTGSVTRTGAGIWIIVAGVGLHLVPPSSWDVGGDHVVLWKPPVSTARWGISHERESERDWERERKTERQRERHYSFWRKEQRSNTDFSSRGACALVRLPFIQALN